MCPATSVGCDDLASDSPAKRVLSRFIRRKQAKFWRILGAAVTGLRRVLARDLDGRLETAAGALEFVLLTPSVCGLKSNEQTGLWELHIDLFSAPRHGLVASAVS